LPSSRCLTHSRSATAATSLLLYRSRRRVAHDPELGEPFLLHQGLRGRHGGPQFENVQSVSIRVFATSPAPAQISIKSRPRAMPRPVVSPLQAGSWRPPSWPRRASQQRLYLGNSSKRPRVARACVWMAPSSRVRHTVRGDLPRGSWPRMGKAESVFLPSDGVRWCARLVGLRVQPQSDSSGRSSRRD
jgi:hypothetical protein